MKSAGNTEPDGSRAKGSENRLVSLAFPGLMRCYRPFGQTSPLAVRSEPLDQLRDAPCDAHCPAKVVAHGAQIASVEPVRKMRVCSYVSELNNYPSWRQKASREG